MARRVNILSRFRFLCIALLLAVISLSAFAAEVFIVAHRDVVDKQLNKAAIERIYLGKKSRWSNGEKLIPVMLKKGELHNLFVKRMLSRDETQFNTYWKQAVFTGRGLPPKSFETSKEMIDYIANTPGSIGYSSYPPENNSIIVIKIQ